jgi:hypothetical protein
MSWIKYNLLDKGVRPFLGCVTLDNFRWNKAPYFECVFSLSYSISVVLVCYAKFKEMISAFLQIGNIFLVIKGTIYKIIVKIFQKQRKWRLPGTPQNPQTIFE